MATIAPGLPSGLEDQIPAPNQDVPNTTGNATTAALARLHHASMTHRFRWLFVAGVPWLALAAWGATTGLSGVAYAAAGLVLVGWLIGVLTGPYLLAIGLAVAVAALVAWRKGEFAGLSSPIEFVLAGGAGLLAVLVGGALIGGGQSPGEQVTPAPVAAPAASPTSSSSSGTTRATAPAPSTTTGTTVVSYAAESITDGDTFRVIIDGESEAVRIIGIDAPESGDCLSEEAADRLGELLANGFRLRRDVSNRDGFGRLLRHVDTDDGSVAAVVIEEGLALSRRYPPDVADADLLDELHMDAQAATRGIWSWETCGAPVLEVATADRDLLVRNTGTGTQPLGGMVVADSTGELYTFPETAALLAAEEIVVSPGCADDIGRRLHACVGAWTGLLTVTFGDQSSTVRFASTPTTTPTTSGGSAAVVEVSALRIDADGNDNENKNDEWVEVTNRGPGPVDLTGWSIQDEGSNHTFRFPSGFVLDERATVRIHSGCGTATPTELFWCNSGSAVWNNDGDIASLLSSDGSVVDVR